MSNKITKKVFVGMSGGVDSSVSAALLQEQGYEVIGVFIKAWEPEGFDCGWREERRDTMRVAAHLKIPFVTLDLGKEYKESVVDYMVAEYKAGRTPNPDVMCNKAIKFGAFFKRAVSLGADYVAMGHYAQIQKAKCQKSNVKSTEEKYEMLAGIDKNKDQTYFLWTLGQEQLSHTLFPVGHLEKTEVRKLAEKFKLPNKTKKDSQGICFVGQLDLKEFLKEFIEEKDGDVLDMEGNVVGKHRGVLFYTLGERHGFEIFKKTPNESPLYVISKDLKNNTITVSDSPFSKDDDKEVPIESVNWVSGQTPDLSKKYQARIRYRQPLQECQIREITPNKFQVVFDQPQASISSGQSVVIYDGEICLGGGVIS